MPKGNYLKRLQAVKNQFVWLKATQLDAVNGVSVMIIWTLVAYYVSVATNQCFFESHRCLEFSTYNTREVCGRMCCSTSNRPHLFFLQILIIPLPSQIVIGADCENKD